MREIISKSESCSKCGSSVRYIENQGHFYRWKGVCEKKSCKHSFKSNYGPDIDLVDFKDFTSEELVSYSNSVMKAVSNHYGK